MKGFASRCLLALALVGATGGVLCAAPVPAEYHQLLRDWYARYLGRAIEPQALAYWGQKMVREGDPAIVQADILASGEYYQRQGGTPARFIQGLFRDVRGVVAEQRDIDLWLARYENIRKRDAFVEAFLQVRRPDPDQQPTPVVLKVVGTGLGLLVEGMFQAALESLLNPEDESPKTPQRMVPPPPTRGTVAEPLRLGKEHGK